VTDTRSTGSQFTIVYNSFSCGHWDIVLDGVPISPTISMLLTSACRYCSVPRFRRVDSRLRSSGDQCARQIKVVLLSTIWEQTSLSRNSDAVACVVISVFTRVDQGWALTRKSRNAALEIWKCIGLASNEKRMMTEHFVQRDKTAGLPTPGIGQLPVDNDYRENKKVHLRIVFHINNSTVGPTL